MPRQSKVVEGEIIVLRDRKGTPRIMMDAVNPGGPVVQLFGDGKSTVELRAFPNKGGVALTLAAGRRHVVVRLHDAGGSFIRLTDGDGRHSVTIEAPPKSGRGAVLVWRGGKVIASLAKKG